MEDLHLLLPICLAGLAAVLPVVGVCWFRRALKEDTNDSVFKPSTLATTNDECTAEHHQPDLLGSVAGGTESMETDDEVAAYLPSSVIHEIAAQARGVLRENSLPFSGQRHVARPKIWLSLGSQDEIASASSIDASREKDQRVMPEKGSSSTSLQRFPTESSMKDRLKPHHHQLQQQQKNQIDVRPCISETCVICKWKQRSQVQFVAAQKLDPKMVQKLKHAPENTRWWEMGESFHDLYHKAQRQTSASFHSNCYSSPRRNGK
jgi:hypothetical protein